MLKVNTLMYGQFSLATGLSSLLAYSNKSPRLIVIQKIVEVYGSTGTVSHFGERLRGGQYTLASFLLPHVALRAKLFVKMGACPRVLWFRTHCLGHGPSVMVWGQGI